MSPVVQQVLLVLWLTVGGALTLLLGGAAAWRSGFHIRAQHNRETGMKEDSALMWLGILAALFMGPPAFFLGIGLVADLLYEIAATMADFWWVMPVLAALLLTGFGVWRFGIRGSFAQGGEVHPAPQVETQAMVHVADDGARTFVPYGQYGDGHL